MNDTLQGINDTPQGMNDTPQGMNDTPQGINDTPQGSIYLLSKHWVELFGDVVLLVVDRGGSQSDHQVGISFAIDVCRVELIGLKHTIHI